MTSSIHLLNLLAGVMASKKADSEKFFHQKDLERILENVFNNFFRKVSKTKIQKNLSTIWVFGAKMTVLTRFRPVRCSRSAADYDFMWILIKE